VTHAASGIVGRPTPTGASGKRPRRVVVAEDEAGLRRCLVRALAMLGCEVTGVGTAAKLEALLTVSPPDAVLLDCTSAIATRATRWRDCAATAFRCWS
jgi:DNA-binding NtrC family response regulator